MRQKETVIKKKRFVEIEDLHVPCQFMVKSDEFSMGYAYLETTGDVDVIPLFYLETNCSDFGKFLVCSFKFLSFVLKF